MDAIVLAGGLGKRLKNITSDIPKPMALVNRRPFLDYIFKYLGRSFMEVGKLDSANWSFSQGLKYNSDDENLLEYAAWNAGKMNNIQDQTYFIERLLEINPDNVRALERMNDTYRKNKMFEDQIQYLNMILDIG